MNIAIVGATGPHPVAVDRFGITVMGYIQVDDAQDAGGQGCSLALLEGLQSSASALAVDAFYKSTSDVHCKHIDTL